MRLQKLIVSIALIQDIALISVVPQYYTERQVSLTVS